jgi:NAD-dependent dihydropyrimidine dehydrogenase PreA subunit
MNPLAFIWGFFFRLFPCPTRLGLLRIGNPSKESPVLVTCNFYITVRRLFRALKGLNLWLLVADSKGVNVWCAAGGEEFNTRSVVSAAKTSGIADLVDHRRLILPPLGAPGICAKNVREETGWSIHWGPVRMKDIPRYLEQGCRRDENMKRATYNWKERLDTGLGSLFPFYFIGALCFLMFAGDLLLPYLVVGAATFLLFMLACPYLPGKHGLTKVIILDLVLGTVLVITEIWHIPSSFSLRAYLIIAMISLLIYGTELGGLASTLRSDLDPFMAKLGIGVVGNVCWSGTIRTDLLLGRRLLVFRRVRCIGCWSCVEVCPQGVWEMAEDKRAVFAHPESCTACRGCLVQCQSEAICLEPNTKHTVAA